jgi:hypothetical protein
VSKIEFIIGDADDDIGWPGSVELEVAYISEYPRDDRGTCAFCHGDPCAEWSPADSEIARYFERNKQYAVTCPCCEGRPT